MKAIVIFTDDNTHPLSWMLAKKTRHVFCATYDERTRMWIEYNQGVMGREMRVLCDGDFNITKWYEAKGYEIFPIETQPYRPIELPFILNNCVGMVKALCGLTSSALTPAQLRRHVMQLPTGDIQCQSYGLT